LDGWTAQTPAEGEEDKFKTSDRTSSDVTGRPVNGVRTPDLRGGAGRADGTERGSTEAASVQNIENGYAINERDDVTVSKAEAWEIEL
jgi:hypothetical protein